MSTESKLDFNEIYNFAIQITQECDDIFREGFNGIKLVMPKDELDLVTDYDHRIENHLKQRILDVYPNHVFLGEETASLNNVAVELTEEPTWVIDPIDGTHMFIKQIPYCAISVAFVYRKEVIVGVVSSPMTNEVFTALKGNGSCLNGNTISTSKVGNDKTDAEILQSTLSVVPRILPGVLRTGSAALTLGYVANGSVLGFYANFLKPWDTAAGILIVREAGGVIYAHDGNELDIMKPDLIAASNIKIGQAIVRLFNGVEVVKPTTVFWDD